MRRASFFLKRSYPHAPFAGCLAYQSWHPTRPFNVGKEERYQKRVKDGAVL